MDTIIIYIALTVATIFGMIIGIHISKRVTRFGRKRVGSIIICTNTDNLTMPFLEWEDYDTIDSLSDGEIAEVKIRFLKL